MSLTVKLIDYGSPAFLESWSVRETVLRHPLGLRFTEEDKEAEKSHIHIAAFIEEKLRAACVLVPRGKTRIKMQRVAVDEAWRGKQIGSELLLFCERHCTKLGYDEIFCHARDTAIPFYEKHGFKTIGAPFIEQTIPHQKMSKILRPK